MARPEGKTRLGRPRARWVDNIKMDFERGCDAGNWMYLAQVRDHCRTYRLQGGREISAMLLTVVGDG